jgi:Phosphotransferase enzyme family
VHIKKGLKMTSDLHSELKAIDPAILTEVVRKDLYSPTFEITEWSVDRLSNKGFMNPDGLWLYRGLGSDNEGQRPWSVVVKILQRPEEEGPVISYWYWKRELLVAQSGLWEQLPEPVKAPRCYRVEETQEGAWLWLELIENHRPEPWGLDDYAFAARQIGKWNGAIVISGRSFDQPWLTRDQLLTWYPDSDPERDMQFPLNNKHITGVLRDRYDRLWAERKVLYDTIEALPKYFAHFDCMRRNLMIRKGKEGQDELVLLDWAQCGMAPLGIEVFHMVGMSTTFNEWPASAVAELEGAVFSSYLQGLHDAGWSGNADLVRLGYVAWFAVWLGIAFPHIMSRFCTPEARSFTVPMLGLAEEELYLQWLVVFKHGLDCADEARQIMQKL